METLDEYLDTRKPIAKTQPFEEVVRYFPDGDFVSCFVSDERCYAKQAGERLTVYYSDSTDEVVGCKVKGVRGILMYVAEKAEAEVVRLRGQRDNLLWLLDREFEERNPGVPKPEWLVFAASLREAAEAQQVQGSVE